MRDPRFLFFALVLSGGAHAQTTWHVPGDAASIQGAIDLATSGDTVLVSPGTYHENLVIQGEDLVLRSLHGARVTIVDGRDLDSVVQFLNGADSVLDGFTLQNGHANAGGGVFSNGSSPSILNCLVRWSSAESDGGGMYLVDGAPRVVNCVVTGNGTVYWDGGGIMTAWAQGGLITNCTIYGNHIPNDGWGAGIWDHDGGILITNCIVRENYAGSHRDDIGADLWTQVWHCNFGLSFPHHGNIDEPPRFVNADAADFHLRSTSPCRGVGSATAPGMLPGDFEGNERAADGLIDMGADEYAPHLYLLGDPSPGATVDFVVVGLPTGTPCSAWLSHELLPDPITTSYGDLWLKGRRVILFEGEPVRGADLLRVRWTIPGSMPPGTNLFCQGLLGPALGGVETMRVE